MATSRVGEEGPPPSTPSCPSPPSPGPADEPITLTDNFIQACAAGVWGTFTGAEAYLTTAAKRDWDPEAKVTVFGSGDFTPVWDDVTSTVTYSLPVIATIDASGIFTEIDPTTPQDVVFSMSQDGSGQWRISGLDNGIVLAEAHFDSLYRSVPLAFATTDGRFAVPDVRWVPRKNAATFAAEALLGGPAPWLADGVLTGLPVTSSLAVQSVPIADGTASVSLDPGAGGTAAERALARLQFTKTLTALPEVSSVDVTVGGLDLAGDPATTSTRRRCLAEPPSRSSTEGSGPGTPRRSRSCRGASARSPRARTRPPSRTTARPSRFFLARRPS